MCWYLLRPLRTADDCTPYQTHDHAHSFRDCCDHTASILLMAHSGLSNCFVQHSRHMPCCSAREADECTSRCCSSLCFQKCNCHCCSCTRLFVLLLHVWQVISHDEEAAKRGQGPLLSAAHQDTAVLWQRVQNVAEVSAQQQQQQQQKQSQGSSSSAAGRIVLTARVVSRNKGGLTMLCMGLQAFLPKSLLPFNIRDLYQQQVGRAEG